MRPAATPAIPLPAALASLPICEVLAPLCEALARANGAILIAPPGAGKTTGVPLALLNQPFAAKGRILLLEPRRLTAWAAAARMAALLGQEVGQAIGLRVRLQSRISAATRLEVITEGVFTRMILDDPMLENVAAVLFDEFHERSLEADLGLALALDAQAGLREDLRILVMSATLDGARVQALMPGAPMIECRGRAFPVATTYLGRDPNERIEDSVARACLTAAANEKGSILAFLPGQAEILRAAATLREKFKNPDIIIAPLYGAMDLAAQESAIAAPRPGQRKIVLATSIAETSLTIEGVRVVIDSGLSRAPRYEPDVGLTRLETRRASRASADQRRGRAGRTEPGVCYRLWLEAASGGMAPFSPPEIVNADLTGFLLNLASWGVSDPAALRFLDPPPAAALAQARQLLIELGALDRDDRITPEGRAIGGLGLPPRLARMILATSRDGQGALGARIAVLLSERGLGGDHIDLEERLRHWRADHAPRAKDAAQLADKLARQAARSAPPQGDAHDRSVGFCLARAFPDRIAMARPKRGEFLMANGRAAQLAPHEDLAGERFLGIGEIAGRAGGARILLAARLSLEEVESLGADLIVDQVEIVFEPASASLRARRRRNFGALALASGALPAPRDAAGAGLLADGLVKMGVERLPWSPALRQWRDRIMFLAGNEPGQWPDLSDLALAANAEWLAPFVQGKISLAEIGADDLSAALKAQAPFALARRLESDAPTHFTAPTGNRFAIDYAAEAGPAIALRVQELFGLSQHPTIAAGKAPLTLHLLSPAYRPIQITKDLPGFWRGSWAGVRADLRGRYPRHSWPEQPESALPTARAKPRGT